MEAPLESPRQSRIGLALSGGGFRATLFHLGVVAAFRDLGRLTDLSVISCVSGGSIIGAHLVLHWPRYASADDAAFDAVARELIAISGRTCAAASYDDCHAIGIGASRSHSTAISIPTRCSPVRRVADALFSCLTRPTFATELQRHSSVAASGRTFANARATKRGRRSCSTSAPSHWRAP